MYQTTSEDTCASITVNKNRIKHISDSTRESKVYLKDKQEFEIELFNPSTVTRLAKISINGTPISSAGIVIKPGQRIYLERFLDSPKKFQFQTYEVNGDSVSALKAIQNNGLVEVSFYNEHIPYLPPINLNTFYYQNIGDFNQNQPFTFTTSSTTNGIPASASIQSCSVDNLSNFKGGQSVNSLRSASKMDFIKPSLKETGRVEQGSTSGQKFTNYSGEFSSWTSKTVTIRILPLSDKPLENKDLVSYCTECGAKNKGGKYKFCPVCGTKF